MKRAMSDSLLVHDGSVTGGVLPKGHGAPQMRLLVVRRGGFVVDSRGPPASRPRCTDRDQRCPAKRLERSQTVNLSHSLVPSGRQGGRGLGLPAQLSFGDFLDIRFASGFSGAAHE